MNRWLLSTNTKQVNLSMGAVFALLAGFYYWTPKIIGKTYNELLGRIQFLSLFSWVLLMIKINTRNMSVKGGYLIIEKYNGSNNGLVERNYTTNSNDALNPWFITGFSDAESSFSVSCFKNDKLKIGWEFQPAFSIGLHLKDLGVLLGFRLLVHFFSFPLRKRK
jgi:LAGLIDADG endonuclease